MKLIKVDGDSRYTVEFRPDVYIVKVNEPGHVGSDLWRYDVTGFTRKEVIETYMNKGFISEAEHASTV